MTNVKKQLKITKLFRKGASRPFRSRVPEECEEILEEVRLLEEKLKEKQNELFQIQRNKCKQKMSPPKKSEETFVRPQKIILSSSISNLKCELQLMSMLTGLEVQSYEMDDHCCVVFHMQHDSEKEVKHGLRIDLRSENNTISKSSLPLGFNIKAVMEDFDNIMMPECLQAIRNGLVAYYNRLEQFQKLKNLVNVEADLFKLLDASHIEISFDAQSEIEEDDEHIHITLVLDYRVYDIRPKNYSFKEKELPEGVSDALREQCSIFKRKPLHKAFKEAFLDGIGPYRLVQRLGVRSTVPRPKHKRFRSNKQNYNNDDTFLPEDCSDQGDNDDNDKQ